MSGAEVAAFAEHGEVLAHWARLGYRGETVLCFDRHLDLKVLPPPQLARIEAAAGSPEALAALDRDLPFRDDDRFAYGLDSFLYAAAHLGLCRRLIWVAPEPEPLPDAALGRLLWEHVSLLPGHGAEVERTFAAGEASWRADVAGMTVEVTTLRRLAALGPRAGWRVDVDLDYFCDDEGRPVHAPREAAAALSELGLGGALDGLTRSISSGFLPRELASLAEDLAGALGLAAAPGGTDEGAAPRSMAALAGFLPLDGALLRDLAAAELAPLGGPGHALHALLAIRLGDHELGAACFDRARAEGDRASWAAHALGLARMGERAYPEARAWLGRMAGPLTDPLRLRGRIAEALCAHRAGAFEDALALARSCAEQVPLRREAWQIAAAAARALGRDVEARLLDEQASAAARRAPE